MTKACFVLVTFVVGASSSLPVRASCASEREFSYGYERLRPGDLAIADVLADPADEGTSNGAVLRVDGVSAVQTVVSELGYFQGGPADVVIDAAGDLLVLEADRQAVVRVDPTTGAQMIVGSTGALPVGLAVEANGQLLVLRQEFSSSRVLRMDPMTGASATVTSGGLLLHSTDLVAARDQWIYVVGSIKLEPPTVESGVVRVHPVTGVQQVLSSGGFLQAASGIEQDQDGSLVVIDGTGVLVRIEPVSGAQTLISSGGYLDSATSALTIRENGSIVVATSAGTSGRLVDVDPLTGAQTLFAYGGFLTHEVQGLAVVPGAPQALDIEEISIGLSKGRFDGVLGPSPYTFQVGVVGAGIASVSVETPSLATQILAEDEGQWEFFRGDLAGVSETCNDPNIGCGDFVFTITGLDASVETIAVTFDPGDSDPHPGYGRPTYPIHGQTGVSLAPTLTWDCVNPACGSFAWFLEVFPTGEGGNAYEADILDPAASQWAPGTLTAETTYGFWLTAGTILGGGPQTVATTPGGDLVLYAPLFETTNEIEFTTRAEGTAVPGFVDALTVSKVSPTELLLSWSGSGCQASPQDYGVSQGTIGDWYSHTTLDCHDDGADLEEPVTMPPGDAYFLVVPFTADGEGSYGSSSISGERPQAPGSCRIAQMLGCP